MHPVIRLLGDQQQQLDAAHVAAQHTLCSHSGMAEVASWGKCSARDATAKLPDASAPLYTSALGMAMMSADMRYCARSVTTACIAKAGLRTQGCKHLSVRAVCSRECRLQQAR